MRAQLEAVHCSGCGSTVFPKVATCPACGAGLKAERCFLPSTGTIVNSTVVHVSLPHLVAPYVVAFVELENEVTVFCRIRNWEPGEGPPPVGTRVELVAGGDAEWWAEARQ